MKPEPESWIAADWPAAGNISAGITTRKGGVSSGNFASFNLANHVGDDKDNVRKNRKQLGKLLQLPAEPYWLQQVHGNRILKQNEDDPCREADGCYTNQPAQVCVVMTADCLPILLCDKKGEEIAAIHVGWRGFSRNIVHQALNNFKAPPEELLAWMGPCISPKHYEIDEVVRDACLQIAPAATAVFTASRPGHWFADIKQLASLQLSSEGIQQINMTDHCTYRDDSLFYSYRRDGNCGRMATMIWMDNYPV